MGDAAQLDTDNNQELDTQQPIVEIENEVVIHIEGQEELELETPTPAKRNPVRDMRKRIKEQNRENTDLSKANQSLQDRIHALENPVTPAPVETPKEVSNVAPTLADCGYDTEKFQTEYSIWNDAQLDKRLEERLGKRDTRVQKDAATQQTEDLITSHYQRASNLAVGDYEQTEDVAVAALGVQLVQSIQTTVDNSEALIYWLGKNPEEAAKLAVIFDANPSKGTLALGALSGKVSFKPKGGKGAPEPEIAVRGGGGSTNTTLQAKFNQKLAEASNAENPLAARKQVRDEANAAGITLPFNTV